MGFEQIAGQDLLVRVLKRSLKFHEVGHAYLLQGLLAVGKTLAFLFAQALNCTGQNRLAVSACRAEKLKAETILIYSMSSPREIPLRLNNCGR